MTETISVRLSERKRSVLLSTHHARWHEPVSVSVSDARGRPSSSLEVLGEVDDAPRVVLVLEARELLGVRGVVALVRFIRRVRAVDVVDYGIL